VGGLVVVSDPPGELSADRWPTAGCAQFGLRFVRHVVEPWSLTVLELLEPCPGRYPRRVGIPLKRPLF
jgi:hypothetical protein